MRAQMRIATRCASGCTEERRQRQEYIESEEDLADRSTRSPQPRRREHKQHCPPLVKDKMPRRNDPCPCGSGRKFKGATAEESYNALLRPSLQFISLGSLPAKMNSLGVEGVKE